jgi:septal ring factor EnvC (AmiA/AmiB activator)
MESKMTDNYFEDLLVGAEPWSIEQVREDYERVQETLGQARVWAKDLKTDLDQTRKDRDSAEATIARLQEEKALLSIVHEEARTNLIKKRDEARAERDLAEAAWAELKDKVVRLRSSLAEPNEEEAERLWRVVQTTPPPTHLGGDDLSATSREWSRRKISALLATLRERAGGGDE